MNEKEGFEIALYIIKIGQTGITWFDLLSIIFCPLAGMLGTLAGTEMQRKHLMKKVSERTFAIQAGYIKEDEEYTAGGREIRKLYEEYIKSEYQMFSKGNVVLGLVLGFSVSLYFMGAIVQDLTSLARIAGLCIILGYITPGIWKIDKQG